MLLVSFSNKGSLYVDARTYLWPISVKTSVKSELLKNSAASKVVGTSTSYTL